MVTLESFFFIASGMILFLMGICYLFACSGLQTYRVYGGSESALGIIWLAIGGLSIFFWIEESMLEIEWFLPVVAAFSFFFGLYSFYLVIFKRGKTYKFGKIKKLVFSVVHILLSAGFLIYVFL